MHTRRDRAQYWATAIVQGIALALCWAVPGQVGVGQANRRGRLLVTLVANRGRPAPATIAGRRTGRASLATSARAVSGSTIPVRSAGANRTNESSGRSAADNTARLAAACSSRIMGAASQTGVATRQSHQTKHENGCPGR